MKIKPAIQFLLVFFFLLATPFSAGCSESVKEPAVAGTFYPSDKEELKETVEVFLSKAEKISFNGKIIALISPHAGYRYSGQVAAYGYKQIENISVKRVILIGPSHRVSFRGASVYAEGVFETPLGTVKIDEKTAKSLLNESADVRFFADAFAKEHSLEVQLPFLQTVLKDFSIVPVLIGSLTRDSFEHLASQILNILDDGTLLIASTDLSHYHDYETAKAMDGKIMSVIERLSLMDTERLVRSGEAELCGVYPVLLTMEIVRRAAGASIVKVFKYANSGDVTGEKDKVVGYASIGILKNPYSEHDKNELLSLAVNSIREYVTNGKTPEFKNINPKFVTDGAVFVTIKNNGSLRGCIGHIQPVMPLYQSVIKNAVAACSSDRRFPPLTKDELKDIEVEVSILSPLVKVKNTEDIMIGRHGLVIRKGMRRGILLPQVATEFGWDRETFLEQLCAKAGLSRGAWKDAELYIFTAEIIK